MSIKHTPPPHIPYPLIFFKTSEWDKIVLQATLKRYINFKAIFKRFQKTFYLECNFSFLKKNLCGFIMLTNLLMDHLHKTNVEQTRFQIVSLFSYVHSLMSYKDLRKTINPYLNSKI